MEVWRRRRRSSLTGLLHFCLSAGSSSQAEKNDLSKWYPKDLQVRSRILQYLSWHTSHVRKSTSDLLHPVVGAAFGGKDLDKEAFAKAQESFTKQLQLLEGWLENSKFLATDDHPTIADLQAYCEIDQIEAFNLMDLSPFKKVQAWIVSSSVPRDGF